MSDMKDDEIIEVEISDEAKDMEEKNKRNEEREHETEKPDVKEKNGRKEETKPKHHKKHEEIIRKLKEENKELSDRLLRRLAEFENYKKRVFQEKETLVKEKLGKFIFDLLNILDNFDRALSHISKEERNSSLYQGITLIDKQFHDLLSKYGVKEIDTSSGIFDPFYHQALDKEEVDEDLEKPMISKVFQKGYTFNDTVLRPTLVKVKIKKEKTKEAEDDKEDDTGNNNKLN